MPIKTTLIAVGAAIAFSASILVATSSCSAAPTAKSKYFERSIHGTYELAARTTLDKPRFVVARGVASGHGGYLVRRVRARYRALAKWRIEAARLYGPGATRWTLATQKNVNCQAVNGAVQCVVSAHPANLLQRLGLGD